MRDPQIISPAMRRVLQRRAASAEHAKLNAEAIAKQPKTWRRVLRIAEHAIAISAGLAAIAGVLFWLAEAPDRDEERSLRRAEMVARAYAILSAAEQTGRISAILDPNIEWAIDTLASTGSPIKLTAAEIDLSFISLDCAFLRVEAANFSLFAANVDRSHVTWTGRLLDARLETLSDTELSINFRYTEDPELMFGARSMTNSLIDGVPSDAGLQFVKIDDGLVNFENVEVRNYDKSRLFGRGRWKNPFSNPDVQCSEAMPDGSKPACVSIVAYNSKPRVDLPDFLGQRCPQRQEQ